VRFAALPFLVADRAVVAAFSFFRRAEANLWHYAVHWNVFNIRCEAAPLAISRWLLPGVSVFVLASVLIVCVDV
jgi:hypothetical protein